MIRPDRPFANPWDWAAAAAFAIAAAMIVLFVEESSRRDLASSEEALWTIFIALFSILASVYAGWRLSAEGARRQYKPFVDSAGRRVHDLQVGLEDTLENVQSAVLRVQRSGGMDEKAILLLWDEVANTIYVQLNEVLRSAKASVDDWKKLSPQEFEMIEEREDERRRELRELTEKYTELSSVITDLSEESADRAEELSELRGLADGLRQEIARTGGTASLPTAVAYPRSGEARTLLATGAYEKAVEAYTKIILANPSVHTVYIGRARARHLAGDTRGALEDLARAESLYPADPVIERLRAEFQGAAAAQPPTPLPVMSKLFEGNDYLKTGRPDEALRCYKEAEELQVYRAYAHVSLSMAYCVLSEPQKALELLDKDPGVVGPFVNVELQALRVMANALAGKQEGSAGSQLEAALRAVGRFDLSRSPLRFLRMGLAARELTTPETEEVFQLLASSGVAPV